MTHGPIDGRLIPPGDDWMSAGIWSACTDEVTIRPDLPYAIGMDVASDHATLIVIAQRQADGSIAMRCAMTGPAAETMPTP